MCASRKGAPVPSRNLYREAKARIGREARCGLEAAAAARGITASECIRRILNANVTMTAAPRLGGTAIAYYTRSDARALHRQLSYWLNLSVQLNRACDGIGASPINDFAPVRQLLATRNGLMPRITEDAYVCIESAGALYGLIPRDKRTCMVHVRLSDSDCERILLLSEMFECPRTRVIQMLCGLAGCPSVPDGACRLEFASGAAPHIAEVACHTGYILNDAVHAANALNAQSTMTADEIARGADRAIAQLGAAADGMARVRGLLEASSSMVRVCSDGEVGGVLR